MSNKKEKNLGNIATDTIAIDNVGLTRSLQTNYSELIFSAATSLTNGHKHPSRIQLSISTKTKYPNTYSHALFLFQNAILPSPSCLSRMADFKGKSKPPSLAGAGDIKNRRSNRFIFAGNSSVSEKGEMAFFLRLSLTPPPPPPSKRERLKAASPPSPPPAARRRAFQRPRSHGGAYPLPPHPPPLTRPSSGWSFREEVKDLLFALLLLSPWCTGFNIYNMQACVQGCVWETCACLCRASCKPARVRMRACLASLLQYRMLTHAASPQRPQPHFLPPLYSAVHHAPLTSS